MVKDKNKKSSFVVPEPKEISYADESVRGDGIPEINMFDSTNPDIGLFNSVDGELIGVAGSEILIFGYTRDENYDDLYEERRGKVIYHTPISVYGHYDPRPVEENLSEFGIELTNDQTFTFNKSSIVNALKRPLHPGDVIKPKFQNLYFEIYEVQEDSFEAYGVFHLLASAKVLRDAEELLKDYI
jgi:hypothetical protein